MKTKILIPVIIGIAILIYLLFPVGQKISKKSIFAKENLVAWCVVPFDQMNRSPSERAIMLKEMGFTKFAYDWRAEHLPYFPTEIDELDKNGISLYAVWFWISGNGEQILNEANEEILRVLKEKKKTTELWVSFDYEFFHGLSDSACLQKSIAAIHIIHQRAAEAGCTLALYNHGDWFGEPENQIRIIKESGLTDIRIVYNFHHGHHQIERFPQLLDSMMPYLSIVNINGMNRKGPKILPVGEGEEEKAMLRILKDSGFSGQIGILGHTEGLDIRDVLVKNLKGLEEITLSF